MEGKKMKRYIELNENANATHLVIETKYNLGGLNCFTYAQEKRGYYLHVYPVKRETRNGYTLESFGAFTGTKHCIKEVTRQSAKAAAQAEENALNYIHNLVCHVCRKNGFTIPAEFIAPEAKTI
jgi:hypothetical protein